MTAPFDPGNNGELMPPTGGPMQPPPLPPIPNAPTQFNGKGAQHVHVPPHKKGHAHKGGPKSSGRKPGK